MESDFSVAKEHTLDHMLWKVGKRPYYGQYILESRTLIRVTLTRSGPYEMNNGETSLFSATRTYQCLKG